MPDTPIFAPDGKVRVIPEDQVQAALAAGGKQATKMLDPKGTNRWVPNDQVEAATKAGGTVVKADNTFTVKPTEGENFLDTMKRAAAAGKSVTPETITQQTKTGLKEAPAVLAAAPAIGAGGAAALAAPGEIAAGLKALLPVGIAGAKALAGWAEKNPMKAYMLYQLAKEAIPGVKKTAEFVKHSPTE